MDGISGRHLTFDDKLLLLETCGTVLGPSLDDRFNLPASESRGDVRGDRGSGMAVADSLVATVPFQTVGNRNTCIYDRVLGWLWV